MLVCISSSFVREFCIFLHSFCLSYVRLSCLLKQHSKDFGDFPTIKLKSLSWLVFSNAVTFSRHFPFSQLSIGYIYQHGVAINMYLLMYLYKSAACFLIICNSSFFAFFVLSKAILGIYYVYMVLCGKSFLVYKKHMSIITGISLIAMWATYVTPYFIPKCIWCWHKLSLKKKYCYFYLCT